MNKLIILGLISFHALACSNEADHPVIRPRPARPVLHVDVDASEIPDLYSLMTSSVENLRTRRNLLDHRDNLYSAYRCSQIINKHFYEIPMNLMIEFVAKVERMPIRALKSVNACEMHRKEIDMEFIHRVAFMVLYEQYAIGHLANAIIESYLRTNADLF